MVWAAGSTCRAAIAGFGIVGKAYYSLTYRGIARMRPSIKEQDVMSTSCARGTRQIPTGISVTLAP